MSNRRCNGFNISAGQGAEGAVNNVTPVIDLKPLKSKKSEKSPTGERHTVTGFYCQYISTYRMATF